MNIYKIAAQTLIRFPSGRGDLMVEQLFQLPLKDLNVIGQTIHGKLSQAGTVTFIEEEKPDPTKVMLETALEIVKDVIATKMEINTATVTKAKKAEERRKLLDAYENKKNDALSKMSLKELEKKLEALED